MNVLFIQNRASKAGAQVCLAKTLDALQKLNIQARVIMGEEGWLTQRLRDLGALGGVAGFPAFRAPLSRWLRIRGFSRLVNEVWGRYGPFDLIHANDIWESLLAQWLAVKQNRPWLVHLRTKVTESHFYKYHGNQAPAVVAVSPFIRDLVEKWDHRVLAYIPDGLREDEFWPVVARECPVPQEIGVIGHGGEVKGWDIFARAMHKVAGAGGALPARVVFIGEINPKARKDLAAQLPAAIETVFAGRIDGFAEKVRSLDLVVAPSRQESFGLANMETLAAGVPLLASRTGIAPEIMGADPPWTFTPGDPESLAQAWLGLSVIWPGRHEVMRDWQDKLRREFMVDQTAEKLLQVYRQLLDSNHGKG
jgi:glycosyltransferase involved in cell wall biosynthesis